MKKDCALGVDAIRLNTGQIIACRCQVLSMDHILIHIPTNLKHTNGTITRMSNQTMTAKGHSIVTTSGAPKAEEITLVLSQRGMVRARVK